MSGLIAKSVVFWCTSVCTSEAGTWKKHSDVALLLNFIKIAEKSAVLSDNTIFYAVIFSF